MSRLIAGRRGVLAAAVVVVLAAAGLFAMRPWAASPPTGEVFAEDGIAIRGTDPVAYFTEGRPVAGDPAFATERAGTTWYFVSAANRDAFVADPERYMPQYGGYCAWAVGAKNQTAPTDPDAWRIVDGKLYLNYDAAIQDRWLRDVPGFIQKADRNWPGIRDGLTASGS